MVPMLTCGLVRSNFAFATGVLLWTSWFAAPGAGNAGAPLSTLGLAAGSLRPAGCSLAPANRPGPSGVDAPGRWGSLPGCLRDDLLGDVLRNLVVGVELHRVARPALSL